jgi:hypothetical protein
VSENGGDCDQLATITRGIGGIWLANGIAEPQPSNNHGCSGNTFCVIPGDDEEPERARSAMIRNLRLLPVRRSARAGTRFRVRVRVTNRGDAAGRVTVRLRSTNRLVRVRRQIGFRIPAGATVVRNLPVAVHRRARGKARLVARAHGMTARSVLTVKAPRTKNAKKRTRLR